MKLIDDQGSQIAAGAVNITGGGSPVPCRCVAEITFPAGTLAGARSLLLQSSAIEASSASVGNVVQVISPTAPAATTAKKFRTAKVLSRKQLASLRRAATRLR